MSTMSRNFDILKNKTNSQNVSSAKKNENEINKNAENSKINALGKGRQLHNQLQSESGFERAQAMAEIAMMIFGGGG